MEALIITEVRIVAAALVVILLAFVSWRHVDAVASAFSWCRSVDINHQAWMSRTST
jgi:hypothetical protein